MAPILVDSIPPSFACADLRDFFAPEVESGCYFDCFHFLKRPSPVTPGTLCAVIRTSSAARATQLRSKYEGRPWMEADDARICTFRELPEQLRVAERAAEARGRFQTRAERRAAAGVAGAGELPELRPPHWLARGNVGTCTRELRAAVASCRLPPSALVALGLDVGLSAWARPARAHGAEPPPYGAGAPPMDALARGAQGGTLRAGTSWAERRARERRERVEAGQGSWLLSRADACEDAWEPQEWDRHLALTDEGAWERSERPTSAYWNSEHKERFEEEIEATWEKGGSGLVFYTDEAHWRAQESAEDRLVDGWGVEYAEEGVGEAPPPPAVPRASASLGAERRDARTAAADVTPHEHQGRTRRGKRPRSAAGEAQAALHLDGSNVGFRMLLSMGWSDAQPALGKRKEGRVMPVGATLKRKLDRHGLG